MPANARRRPKRETVDLSQFPDLVAIYLGMRVNTWTGVKTLLGFGPKIARSVEDKPDGLLLHENLLYSLRHLGMRQYWRDFAALEGCDQQSCDATISLPPPQFCRAAMAGFVRPAHNNVK